MFNTALDWPLSREEKTRQLLKLYNDEVKTADNMLCSGEKTMEALREELDAVRSAAGMRKAVEKTSETITSDGLGEAPPQAGEGETVKRLLQSFENAAALLRAMLPMQNDDDDDAVREATPPKARARSEGAARQPAAVALRPALCRTPRNPSRPKRRVSFGNQPEEEPTHDADIKKDANGGDTILTSTSQQAPVTACADVARLGSVVDGACRMDVVTNVERPCDGVQNLDRTRDGTWRHHSAPADAGYCSYDQSSQGAARFSGTGYAHAEAHSSGPWSQMGYHGLPPGAGYGAPHGPGPLHSALQRSSPLFARALADQPVDAQVRYASKF